MNRKTILVVSLVTIGIVIACIWVMSRRQGREEQQKQAATPSARKTGPVDGRRVPARMEIGPAESALAKAAPHLPDNIKLIAGLTDEKSYLPRLKAVHSLGITLGRQDTEALYLVLDIPYEAQGDMDLRAFNAIKNDIVEALLRQNSIPDDLGRKLIQMYRDKSRDEVWRSYCVQFFGPYYAKKWSAGSKPAAEDADRKAVEAALWAALDEKENTIGGTALIGIEALSRSYPEFALEKVAERSLALATDNRSSVHTKITAIQTCGMLRVKDIVPTARLLAQTGEVIPLRLASIWTLGQIGNADDRELLQSLLAGSEKDLHKAAGAALKALDDRLQAPSPSP